MKRLLALLCVLLTLNLAVTLHGDSVFEHHDPFQIPTLPDCGQIEGPGFIGDSTIVDNRGMEGTVVRVKSHLDLFDLTAWGPDPALGIGPCQPLPPHTLELRDSSNNVILKYTGDNGGQWEFRGKIVQVGQ